MSVLPGILPILGSLSTAYGVYKGAHESNKMNREMAREQMAFQDKMSSTAYQRAMHDMEQAGLNPMLAYQQGGASTPAGSTAVMQDELGKTVTSAMDVKRTFAELANLKAMNEKLKTESDLNRALKQEANVRTDVKSIDIPKAKIVNSLWNKVTQGGDPVTTAYEGAKSAYSNIKGKFKGMFNRR